MHYILPVKSFRNKFSRFTTRNYFSEVFCIKRTTLFFNENKLNIPSAQRKIYNALMDLTMTLFAPLAGIRLQADRECRHKVVSSGESRSQGGKTGGFPIWRPSCWCYAGLAGRQAD
jgi:hypothetical protein